MSNRKRRIRRSLDSSSEEDNAEDKTPIKTGQNFSVKSTRSSERIQKRQNRSFRMPSRDDVWNDILPTKSPEKYYHLKPRKLINNFTKENNSYNYDPVYTSGSESMDDFIDDEDDGNRFHYRYIQRDRQKKKKTTHRIKHRRTRLIQESSDSDSVDVLDDINDTDKCVPESGNKAVNEAEINLSTFDEEVCLVEDKNQDKKNENKGNINKTVTETGSYSKFSSKENNKDVTEKDSEEQTKDVRNKGSASYQSVNTETPSCSNGRDSECDSDDQTDIGANLVSFKRSQVIESDSSSEEENVKLSKHLDYEYKQTNEDIEEIKNEDDDENNDNAVAQSDGDDTDSFIVDDDVVEDLSDSTDDNEEVSDVDSETDSDEQQKSNKRKTRVRKQMVQKKKERDELFEQFRAARRKRKSKENNG